MAQSLEETDADGDVGIRMARHSTGTAPRNLPLRRVRSPTRPKWTNSPRPFIRVRSRGVCGRCDSFGQSCANEWRDSPGIRTPVTSIADARRAQLVVRGASAARLGYPFAQRSGASSSRHVRVPYCSAPRRCLVAHLSACSSVGMHMTQPHCAV
jgi:hypothetical protein